MYTNVDFYRIKMGDFQSNVTHGVQIVIKFLEKRFLFKMQVKYIL